MDIAEYKKFNSTEFISNIIYKGLSYFDLVYKILRLP